MSTYANIELGVGLLKLGGRAWGGGSIGQDYRPEKFLGFITKPGSSRFLDTAPAYDSLTGSSEVELGNFLRRHRVLRKRLTISTKFGEEMVDGQSVTDHSEKGLRASLDRSITRLGTVPDVLFVHKATTALFEDPSKKIGLDAGLAYAKRRGVKELGASVSDTGTAINVLMDRRFSYIQFPLNVQRRDFEEVLQKIREQKELRKRVTVVINRPFGEGKEVAGLSGQQKDQAMDAAYTYIRDKVGHAIKAIILTGASSKEHYKQNRRSLLRVLH